MFRVVLELLIVKEDLLARRKDKFGATIAALQYSIGEFHDRFPQTGTNTEIGHDLGARRRSRFPVLVRDAQQGPGPLEKKRHLKFQPNAAGKERPYHRAMGARQSDQKKQ